MNPERASMRLRGRVALVTGCGPNINAGIAYGLAEEGAKLVCVDRLTDYAEACARGLRNRGAEAAGPTVDVTRGGSARADRCAGQWRGPANPQRPARCIAGRIPAPTGREPWRRTVVHQARS